MGVLLAGDPESNSVQEILAFQTRTIRMMYGLIGDALKAQGSPDHPQDYLNFFCLGNREAKYVTAPPAKEKAPLGSFAAARIAVACICRLIELWSACLMHAEAPSVC